MTRIKTLLASGAAAAALVLGAAGAASAGNYPPANNGTIDVQGSVNDPVEGTPVVVTATKGFCPVPGTWTYVLNPGNIALLPGGETPEGDIELTAPLPALEAGTYTITFSCNPTLTATITVSADGTFAAITDSGGSTGGGGIPDTGSNTTSTTLQIAAIALAAGLGMLGLAAIRRRTKPVAA